MRPILNTGWDGAAISKGVLVCLILAPVTYELAALALRVRTG